MCEPGIGVLHDDLYWVRVFILGCNLDYLNGFWFFHFFGFFFCFLFVCQNWASTIRIHFWKVSNDFVPTRGVLKSGKLVAISLCQVCEAEEAVAHLFRDCGFSKQVLEDVGVAISYWALWYNRNKIIMRVSGIRSRTW